MYLLSTVIYLAVAEPRIPCRPELEMLGPLTVFREMLILLGCRNNGRNLALDCRNVDRYLVFLSGSDLALE